MSPIRPQGPGTGGPPPDAAPNPAAAQEKRPSPEAEKKVADNVLNALIFLFSGGEVSLEAIETQLGINTKEAKKLFEMLEAFKVVSSANPSGNREFLLKPLSKKEFDELKAMLPDVTSDEFAQKLTDGSITPMEVFAMDSVPGAVEREPEKDPKAKEKLFSEAIDRVIASGEATFSKIAHGTHLTANEVREIMDRMERERIVSPAKRGKSRKVLVKEWKSTAPVSVVIPEETATADGAPAENHEEESETDLYAKAGEIVVEAKKASVSQLQRVLKISYARAVALISQLEKAGVIGPPVGNKPREVLVKSWPPETATSPDTATPYIPLTRAGGAAADLDNTAAASTPDEPPPSPEPTPPPAEPAPAEPEPTPPPAEPAPAPVEIPPAPPVESSPKESFHWFETPRRIMVEASKRFLSKFRGETQPEEEKDYKGSWGDITRNATWGLMSVVASYTGVKLFADLGARAWQDLVSNPAERKRIQDAFLAKEAELGETTEPSAIDQKKARLEEAINASKFLTKEKKAELLTELYASVDKYETKDRSLRKKRDEKIVGLLNEAIQTRVKNTQLFKEGINTALAGVFLASGGTAVWAQGLRGPGFGAVAAYERHKEVMADPVRREQYFREMTVRGFTETLRNLGGGDSKFLSKRGALNAVKGTTNVLRAVGFTSLTLEAFTGHSLMDYALDAWEKHMGSVTPQTPGGVVAEAGGAAGSPEAAGAAGAAGVAAAESASSVEIPEAQIESGLVKKGDGIIKILERQGVEAKAALEAAREADIVRAGGDTRLTTLAIGRLSVFTETQPDGDIEIKFFDSETDKLLTLEEAREAGFTYESGTVPGEIPTDKEIVEHVPEPTPEVEALVDSPAPNDLLDGTFHIYTDAEGHFTSLDPGDGDMLTRMNDAIQELARTGHDDSPEAKFIFEQYRALLSSEGVEPAADLPPAQAAQLGVEEIRTREVAVDKITGTPAGEPMKKFVGEAGKVKFIYDKDTGAVKDAFMPAYTPGRRDIEDSLKEWGITNKEVKAHFFEGASRTHMDGTAIDTSHPERYPGVDRPGFPIQSPENDYRQFVRDTERLTRQEALLYEMEMSGHSNSLEYAHLKKETEELEKFVTAEMKKEFNIKNRSMNP